jgi:hypothetical protein
MPAAKLKAGWLCSLQVSGEASLPIAGKVRAPAKQEAAKKNGKNVQECKNPKHTDSKTCTRKFEGKQER